MSAGQSLVIGTYTEKLPHVDGHATGILNASYDGTGLTGLTVPAGLRNPSWLTATAGGRYLYAVAETVEFEGQPGGGVAAFARDPATGALTLLNTVSSAGASPPIWTSTPVGGSSSSPTTAPGRCRSSRGRPMAGWAPWSSTSSTRGRAPT